MHPMIFATFNFYRKSLLRFPEGKLNGMKGYYYITIKLENKSGNLIFWYVVIPS